MRNSYQPTPQPTSDFAAVESELANPVPTYVPACLMTWDEQCAGADEMGAFADEQAHGVAA
jgi:hypothetical protein